MRPDQEKTGQSHEFHTAPVHVHRVLVVDDEIPVCKAIARVLDREGLTHTLAASGQEGIEAIEAADQPFSLILSDQRMPGTAGTEFLARAKELSPDTVRYLLTGYSEMETIIRAVNQGAVQRFISKPWDNRELRQAIRDGLSLYEQHLDSEKLFSLAKRQNTKLYELNCQLVEATRKLEAQRDDLDQEISALKEKLNTGPESSATGPAQVIDAVCNWLSQENHTREYDTFQHHTLTVLYNHFTDLALRNGMEMPEICLGDGGESDV